MSVLIRGMEMPETCSDCRLSTVIAFEKRPLCDALVEYMSYGEWEKKRLDNCPLVPVPPHGRLIDADVLMENEENISFKDEWHMTVTEAFVSVKNIAHAPTIIEAEEGE